MFSSLVILFPEQHIVLKLQQSFSRETCKWSNISNGQHTPAPKRRKIDATIKNILCFQNLHQCGHSQILQHGQKTFTS